VPKNQELIFTAVLRTKEGFAFDVEVTNQSDLTYLSGRSWKEFSRVYNLQVSQKINFTQDIRGPPTFVTTGNQPVTHPSNSNMHVKKN
jgi:hypothetical protein